MAVTLDPAAAVLRLRADLRAEVVGDEGAYVTGDGALSYYDGELAARLFPLLDGTRTPEGVVAECTGEWDGDDVRGALDELVSAGVAQLVAPGAAPGPDAAFYESQGVAERLAAKRLGDAAVSLFVVGDVDHAAVRDALVASGVGRVERSTHPEQLAGSTLAVVLTDNYLREELEAINRVALGTSTPWLLARTPGTAVWLGPTFRPGSTACWTCVAHRLRINRHEESFAQQRLGRTEPLGSPSGRHRLGDEAGAALAALSAVKALVGIGVTAASIVTLDLVSNETTRHHVTRRPQCPACGDPTMLATQQLAAVRFAPRAKAATTDGGHRAMLPDTMVERFSPQVSPITGVVTALLRSALPVEGLYVYAAGQNIASMPWGVESAHLGLRSTSSGKGMSEIQAKASALGEAIERSSAMFHGDEPRRRATLRELGDEAINPEDLLLFSERQHANRDVWNLGASQFNEVFEPFSAERTTDWSPLWSLTEQRTRWLPTQLIYFACPPAEDRWSAYADSNGCAAGTSLEDATLQGFCELVERDSVALWWYNRVRRPAIDLASVEDPYVATVVDAYGQLGRELWALDLTSDLGIPAVGAVSRAVDAEHEDILISFGAHLDPRIALLRSLGEMNQFIAGVHPTVVNGHELPRFDDPTFLHWCETATLENQPYLAPDPDVAARDVSRWPSLSSDDLADDLVRCQRAVEDAGLELLVVNLTRPDVGLPVVKVVVPGLRHFWPRYGRGRLYDVPVQLGWVQSPTPEEALNPFPIFI